MIFFSVLSVMFGAVARQQIIVSKKIEDRQSLARSGYSGILMVLDIINTFNERDYTPETSSLNDFWTDNPGLFGETNIGDSYFSFEYDYRDNVNGNLMQWYGIIDEERKLNVNYTDKNVLFKFLLVTAGMDNISALELTNAIIDWRDADDVLNNDENNLSEGYEYRKDGYPYAPQNTFFGSLEELLLVKGMSLEVFLSIRDYVTVFSDGKININTVSGEVLIALGLSEVLVKKIILYRSGADMAEGTQDDNIFTSVEEIPEVIKENHELSGVERDELNNLIASGFLTVSSRTFTAVCTGRLKNNIKTLSKTVCVFEIDGGIKYWGYRLQGI